MEHCPSGAKVTMAWGGGVFDFPRTKFPETFTVKFAMSEMPRVQISDRSIDFSKSYTSKRTEIFDFLKNPLVNSNKMIIKWKNIGHGIVIY